MNRSQSDSNIRALEHNITPPNYVAFRSKRCRDDLEDEKFESFKQEMITAFNLMMQKQENEFKNFKPILEDIKKTNEKIENTVSFLAEQNEEIRKRIERLEGENKKDKEYIAILEDKLEDVKRENQKGNFELKNVPKVQPKETKEDLIKMVLCLSKSIDHPICEKEISDIYRIRAKKEATKNSPIIVETNSSLLKTTVIQKCKAYNIKNKDKLRAKHLGFKTNEDTPIFISEHLTPKGARLHFLARDLAKVKSYQFCWTSFGRIYVRKTTESPIILITNEAQINYLMHQA